MNRRGFLRSLFAATTTIVVAPACSPIKILVDPPIELQKPDDWCTVRWEQVSPEEMQRTGLSVGWKIESLGAST